MCLHAHHTAGIMTCQSQCVSCQRFPQTSKQLPGMPDCMTADKRAINISFLHANLYSSLALYLLSKWLFCDAHRFCLSKYVCLYPSYFGSSSSEVVSSPLSAQKWELFVNWTPSQQGVAVKWVVCGADFFSTGRLVFTISPLPLQVYLNVSLLQIHGNTKAPVFSLLYLTVTKL